MDIKRGFGRVGVTLAACSVLLIGMSATVAQAADDKAKDKGSIQVCKKVTGPGKEDYKKDKFQFVIRDKDEKVKIAAFRLGDEDCTTVKKLDDGKYRVVEKDIPKKCDLTINVKKGKVDSIVPRNGVVVVVLEKKDNKVEVTYKNDCKKKK